MNFSGMWKQIQEEPYRLFFPFGILAAMIGVGHWPVYAFGASPHYSALFHSSMQTHVYMTCFILGFLMTAMPKFASAPHATSGEILTFLSIFIGVTAALFAGQWLLAELGFITILISFFLFVKKRIKMRAQNPNANPPLEFIWIPIAMFHGLSGAVLMILSQLHLIPSTWFLTAKLLSEQGFIFCIVIGIGGFMAPRLMGTFRVYSKPGDPESPQKRAKIRAGIILFHMISGILFFLSFFPGEKWLTASYLLRASIITVQYLWTCSYLRFPRNSDFYARLIWVSLWMVVVGSWSAALLGQYRTAMLHVVFIGGFSLMIFSVATMVVLSHGGESEKIRRPLPVLWIAGISVILSLGFRLAAAFYPENYFLLLGIAGTLWTFGAAAWFIFAAPKILRSISGEELEHCHEEAKQRVVHLRTPSACGHEEQKKCCGHKRSADET